MSESEIRELASGLLFPEGPVVLDDGSVVLVEIAGERLTRVAPDGSVAVVAELPGGPNGAALGPDGRIYVANNGGYYRFEEVEGLGRVPAPTGSTGGSIQRVDLDTGEVETLYTHCDGRPLLAPNDLVFDRQGGFWFTDHGVAHGEHPDHPGLLYATADGSRITGAAYGTDATNGVGLSPAGDRVYAAETQHGLVWEWAVPAPGVLEPLDPSTRTGGRLLFDAPEGHLFDSMQVDGEGWVCVATIGLGLPGGITAIAPDGSAHEFVETGDFLTTNLTFGGPDGRTAYVTCSSSGRLVSLSWPRPGTAG